jgi:hypothetical protein
VFVNVPSFSVCVAAGKKKTSVAMSSGRTSPRSISGAVRQKSAVSVTAKSRTTSQRAARSAFRCSAPCIEPTVGFSPITKYPWTLPSAMSATVVMWE